MGWTGADDGSPTSSPGQPRQPHGPAADPGGVQAGDALITAGGDLHRRYLKSQAAGSRRSAAEKAGGCIRVLPVVGGTAPVWFVFVGHCAVRPEVHEVPGGWDAVVSDTPIRWPRATARPP